MLLRIRLSSFLAGVAVAGTFSLYQIRQDIQKSHELLSAQVRSTTIKLDSDWPEDNLAVANMCQTSVIQACGEGFAA